MPRKNILDRSFSKERIQQKIAVNYRKSLKPISGVVYYCAAECSKNWFVNLKITLPYIIL